MTNRLSFMPLGGVGETGAENCMLYETADAAILVDCGVGFAGDRNPGATLYHPDFSFLEPWRSKLKAVVLTHGHEDHVGAIGHFRRKFDVPVFGTPFTLGVAKGKLTECGVTEGNLRPVLPGRTLDIGPFSIETIFVNHSILDTVALLINAGGRKVLHLTDFKIDHGAPEGKVIDLVRLKNIGAGGLDALLMDSTNVFSAGWTLSENVVRANLIECFTRIPGRVLACLFASNMIRIQSLIECAKLTGRKVALTGRSTKEYTRIARELGRLNLDGVDLYDVEEVTRFPDREVMVFVTGSQSEPRSVLQRMSHDMFKPFRMRDGDTLVMSSRMIPGNEGKILEMLNRISLKGVKIISEGMLPPVHASGHAYQDELREILRLTRPKYFIPIHGEHRHLKKHAELALEEGVTAERTLLILNGQKVTLSDAGVAREDTLEIKRCYLTDEGVPINRTAIVRRKRIGVNGLVGVGVIYDKLRKVTMSEVALDLSAMFGGAEENDSKNALSAKLKDLLASQPQLDFESLTKQIKNEVRGYYKAKYNIRPEVAVLINEI